MILPSVPNFRSLGGVPVASGTVRDGLLFRSGAFAMAEAGDVERLATFGIRTLIDLRREKERAREPNRLPDKAAIRLVTFDIAHAFAGDVEAGYWADIADMPDERGAVAAMRRVYAGMPQALHGWLATGFGALAEPEAAPAIIHCAVGKDRTGFVIALLLHVLGASRDTIMADYLASAGRYPDDRRDVYRRRIRQRIGIEPCDDICAALTSVQPAYLQAGLEAVDAGWGGVDAYLESAGLTAAIRGRLRELYVEPSETMPQHLDNLS
ncbi:tyrosine-protein phosphatase [Rhizorhabdus wittichii]|uniref:tyrosine-protein phosphatase n=1 Tax=Rhizorhabdus wittichii TaxID=160791 RepID=UPI0009DA775C|nr:tyrosine-protein phosphatase [Rhizorhabdus wittichii]